MKRVAVLLAGCSNLLGLSPPHEQLDARAIDAPPDAAPPTVHVVVGGTGGAGTVTSEPAGISCPGTCDFTFAPGARVTLSQTGGFGTFTGFFLGGCTGGQTCAITPTGEVTVFARWWSDVNVIFVTSTVQHPGSFDDVGHADQLCNDLAMQTGVPGPFVAWLSTSQMTASQRVLANVVVGDPGPFSRVDGAPFAQLFFNDLGTGKILFPPRLDELGHDVGDDAVVVTDTLPSGGAGPGNHCQDWASESDPALVLAGEPAGGTDRWTSVSTTACNQDAHLYCVSAVAFHQPVSAMALEPILFVSKGTVAGNAGLAAMDSLCATEGASLINPNNLAVVTPGGGQPASARLAGVTPTAGAQRPDGIPLFASIADLNAGARFVFGVPNVAADRSFIDADVWIGGGDFATFVDDCDGWSSTTGTGATRPAATTRDHTFFHETTCDQQAHVYCLNF